ncbi:acyltransferase domain-containing protein, partial [Streptomyces chartreusis]
MQALPDGGAMAAIEADEAEVTALLTQGAVIAAVNGPRAVVVSGTEQAVEQVMEAARERELRVTRLRVSHAFHSPLMAPITDEFAETVTGIGHRRPVVPAVSTLTGRAADGDDWASPDYWVRQVRDAVRFHAAVRTATTELGVTRFLEIGADPVLTGLVQTADPDTTAVATLREGRDECGSVPTALAEMFVRGAVADWAAVFHGTGAHRTDLPTYAFQRHRYWLDATRPATDARGLGLGVAGHPLLGAAVAVAGSDSVLLTARLSVTPAASLSPTSTAPRPRTAPSPNGSPPSTNPNSPSATAGRGYRAWSGWPPVASSCRRPRLRAGPGAWRWPSRAASTASHRSPRSRVPSAPARCGSPCGPRV